jgi:hypothetical protein
MDALSSTVQVAVLAYDEQAKRTRGRSDLRVQSIKRFGNTT